MHLLVKEQESAVKAVKLERLVGNIGAERGGTKGGEQEEDMMTKAETRRVLMLTEPPRPWLHPHYNK